MSNRTEVPFSTTVEVRDTCLCLHLQRAARAVARHFDAALRPLDLTSGQFSLLTALNRPDPPSIGSVSTLLAMDRTTLTANLKPLERRGLVTVAADESDRRARRLRLTPAGRELLAAAVPIWRETHAAIEAPLPRANADSLRADLQALVVEQPRAQPMTLSSRRRPEPTDPLRARLTSRSRPSPGRRFSRSWNSL